MLPPPPPSMRTMMPFFFASCMTPSSIHMQPAGRYLMQLGSKPDPEKLRKWNESSWKLTIYVIFTALAFAVSYKELWFTDSRHFWLGCTHFPPCNLFVTKGGEGRWGGTAADSPLPIDQRCQLWQRPALRAGCLSHWGRRVV